MSPISDDIELTHWWPGVEKVFAKLVDTRKGNPDKDWWSKVIRRQSYGSDEDKYDGWYVKEFLGFSEEIGLGSMPKGFVIVPLKIIHGFDGSVISMTSSM